MANADGYSAEAGRDDTGPKMRYLFATQFEDGHVEWSYDIWPGTSKEDCVRIGVNSLPFGKPQRRETVMDAERLLKESGVPWLAFHGSKWVVDADRLRGSFEELSSISWLTGQIALEPEFEFTERLLYGRVEYNAVVAVYLTPDVFKKEPMLVCTPVEIQNSLASFRLDNPDPSRVGFLMLKFGKTDAHEKIEQAVKGVLSALGLKGVRADDKQYHDDIYWNVATYAQGCGFGIAIFERLESDDFNPNVSLEVRYVLGIGKPVCLLKDRTIRALHADLVGKLYRPFDPQDPVSSIPQELRQWLSDKGICGTVPTSKTTSVAQPPL